MLIKRILQLLLPDERRTGMKVAGAVFLSAMLDFVGLAVLLPVLYLLLDGGGQRQAALWFCLLAFGVIALKSIVAAMLSRYQQRFLLMLYKRLSASLFDAYYHKGLLFIREQGVSRLGHQVNFVCYAFSLNMLAPLLRIAGDGLLIALAIIALLVFDWVTAVILFISFLPFMLFYTIGIRKRLRTYGEQELNARRKQARVVAETFGGFAELEVNDGFNTMKEQFQEGLEQITASRMKMERISRMPMFLSELAIIVGLTLLTVLGSGDIKALIGVFAVAAFRLLPALRGILMGWTQIQNTVPSLQIIETGLAETCPKEKEETKLTFHKEIAINNLTYGYEAAAPVLDHFNCTIHKGEYIGFNGYSGVGKSTLFNLLLGFLQPKEGEVCIDGLPLTPQMQAAWLKNIGYVQQDVFIFQGSLAENIALGCKQADEEKIKQILEQVCLHEWAATLPQGLSTPMGEYGKRLSGGQRQRIGIARALYKEAEVILLDEATSALDNRTEMEINTMLSELRQSYPGLTIMSIAHRESSLSYCDRIITID